MTQKATPKALLIVIRLATPLLHWITVGFMRFAISTSTVFLTVVLGFIRGLVLHQGFY
jgi:hypothetical protein